MFLGKCLTCKDGRDGKNGAPGPRGKHKIERKKMRSFALCPFGRTT